MNRITFTECQDLSKARIGGGAFIGGVSPWPKTTEGADLTLLASLPLEFIIDRQMNDMYVSVFSYYSQSEYFVDEITFHGQKEELQYITEHNTTAVLVHKKGSLVDCAHSIRSMQICVSTDTVEKVFQGSGIKEPPGFIQNENISFKDKFFVLQLYSGDFPEPFRDILGMTDAVGYLFLNKNLDGGVFFSQVS